MENLKSFLDDELDLAAKTEVEAQIRNDEDLQKMSSDFKMISASLKTVDTGTPYGLDKLEARLAQGTPLPAKKVWRWAWVGSVMGLALVAVMFPMFAQSKESAIKYATYAEDAAPASGTVTSGVVTTESKKSYRLPASTARGDSLESDPTLQERSSKSAFQKPPQELEYDQVRSSDSLSTPNGIYLEKSGEVSVRVSDLMRSVDEVTGIAKTFDGFIVNSNLTNQEEGGTANVSLRVPTKNYQAALTRVQAMGEVISVSSASQDITEETIDNTSRMETWAIEEQRLIEELKNARNTKERLTVRRQLTEIRANLEAYRQQVKSLRDRAKYSTINATFVRGDAPTANNIGGSWTERTFRDAKEGLKSTGQVFGALGIYALVFSPIWLPLAIGFYVTKRRR